jgi:hypothetical protein
MAASLALTDVVSGRAASTRPTSTPVFPFKFPCSRLDDASRGDATRGELSPDKGELSRPAELGLPRSLPTLPTLPPSWCWLLTLMAMLWPLLSGLLKQRF